MSPWRAILREVRYRWTNFVLGVIAMGVAAGCIVAAMSLVDRYRQRSEMRAAEEQASLRERMAALEDDYRKISLGLGFNLMILPKDQNLADFYAEDFAAKVMPESYAEKLAAARLATINHVLPILQQRIAWPEQSRTIQLIGTRGEVALVSKGSKAALQDPVLPGNVVVGYELHKTLNLSPGRTLTLQGKRLKVAALQKQRGNQDDITLWINLAEAQELLKRPGQINAILALECNCAANRLAVIREDVGRVLPDTQVIEFASQALARAEARNRAAVEAKDALRVQQESRRAELRERERLFALLLPVVLSACGVWAGVLAWTNVRGRVAEIGILRALGVPGSRVLAIFLGRAVLVGLLGGIAGFLAGWTGSWLGEHLAAGGPPLGARFSPVLCGSILVGIPLFAAVVSFLPALKAAELDPVACLRKD